MPLTIFANLPPNTLQNLSLFDAEFANLASLASVNESVVFYGAVGGATDDTTIDQAVIAGLKHIFVPAGITTLVTALTIPANTEFEVRYSSMLKKYGTGFGVLANIGGNYVTLRGGGTLDSNNTPVFSDGKSYLTVDGLILKSSSYYGVHLQNNNHATLKNLHILNTAQYSIFAHTASAFTYNLGIFDNLIDHTNAPFDGIMLATTDPYIAYNTIVSRNRMQGNPASTGQGIVAFSGAFHDKTQNLIIAENAIKNFTFGVSVNAGLGAVVSSNAIMGATEIGIEIIDDENSAVTGNTVANGVYGASINNVLGATFTGNTLRYSTTFGIDLTGTTSGVAVTGNTVLPSSGTGLGSSGNDIAIVGNVLNGALGATTGISLYGGARRVIVGNYIYNFTTAISGIDPTTDTIVGNNVMGAILHGSYSGYDGTEVMLAGGAATTNVISTIATGAPLMAFHHRGTSNTGTWEWANGTDAGSVQMSLSEIGDLSVTGQVSVGGVFKILQIPAAVGTGAKTISNAADGTANFGHYVSMNFNGTVYYLPCSTVAPT